jgi:iron-sulfur cluster repair protein YtfE (RIC family)
MPKAAQTANAQTVNVLDLLTTQHDEIDQLIAQLETGTGDRSSVFRRLADELVAHATVEEEIFYPAVMLRQTSALLHVSVEEHLAIKRVLADMLKLDLDAERETFDAKLAVLKEEVSRHAHQQEESQLFPIVRKTMDDDELAALGNEVLASFETLMKQEPRRLVLVPEETDQAARLPDIAAA